MADDQRKRIAVVAVHGVADQQPQETVCSIGNLLQSLPASGGSIYTPFAVEPLRMPVRPLDLSGAPVPAAYAADDQRPAASSYDSASQINRQSPPTVPGAPDTAYEFMYGQLRSYRGGDPADTYQTTRLAGVRRSGAGERDVHVYEMYWADLSRLGSGVLRVFGELYQLIFHLSSLGVHAVNAASNVDGFERASWFERATWKVWAWCQRRAANMLAVWIALLNIALVGLAAIALLMGLTWDYREPAAIVVTVLIVLGASGAFAFGRAAPSAAGLIGFALLGAGVAGGAAWGSVRRFGAAPVTALELLLVVGALFAWVVNMYRRRRPEAGSRGALIGVSVAAWLVVAILRPGTPSTTEGAITAVLSAVEAVYLTLIVFWALFTLALLVAHFAGALVKIESVFRSSREQRARIVRACWTARLTLAVPASLFLVMTLALWEFVSFAVGKVIPDFSYPFALLGYWFPTRFKPLHSREVIGYLVRDSGTTGFGILLILIALAAAIAVWALLPAVLTELAPPRSSSSHQTLALGRWLTNGFTILRSAGRLVYFGFAVVLPVFAILASKGQIAPVADFLRSRTFLGSTVLETADRVTATGRLLTDDTFLWFDLVLAASAGTLMLVRGRLKNLALGLRSPLDVLLDVDGYLREHPTDGNPRARIVARYASLLRYICQWRDRDGRPYDAVVVIAHSQGAVITADLLRFLTLITREPELACVGGARLPIVLFTMGAPLRQLYELRFPHLYTWMDEAVRTPEKLGLAGWVNTFRSGDYVGRDLGLALPAERTAAQPTPDRWREFGLGRGAHTHYWDATAPEVSRELDRLIASV